LAKQRPTPPGKIRTREHVIADLGLHHVEGHVLRCGFTLQRIHSDYGRPTRGLFSAGETINVHIATRNRISQRAIRGIARYKHEIDRQLSGKVHHHV
jgi:hypothetical protein